MNVAPRSTAVSDQRSGWDLSAFEALGDAAAVLGVLRPDHGVTRLRFEQLNTVGVIAMGGFGDRLPGRCLDEVAPQLVGIGDYRQVIDVAVTGVGSTWLSRHHGGWHELRAAPIGPPAGREPDPDVRRYLLVVSRPAAAQPRTGEPAGLTGEAGLLLQISRQLGVAVTEEDVCEVVCDVVAPALGGTAAILGLPGPNGRLHTLGRVAGAPLLPLERRALPLDQDDGAPGKNPPAPVHPLVTAVRERARVIVPGPHGGLAVPLRVGPVTVGGLWVSLPGGVTTRRDMLDTVTALVAQAVQRAAFYEAQLQANLALQHALLPPSLPEVPGMDVAARYRPGSSEEVGGDWYDVVPLDGGGTAFVIGDVQGHDLAAAALMGQLRSVVRAYLLDRQPPTAVLAAANSFLHSLGSDRIATACIALADTATRLVTVASAGHACPALVPVEDPPQLLTLDVGPPLGAVPDAVYRERTMLVPPTAQLVLYTDGLIERRAQAYDVGEKQLLAGLHGHGDLPPQELADVVFAVAGVVRTDRPSSTGPSPAAQEAEDDTALLAVRWRIEPAESRVRDRELPVSRESAVIARWYVGDVLPAWGVEPGRVETAVLLTDELVSNAVRHAYRQIRLTVRVDPAGVTVEVFDDSHREPQLMPPDIRATSGRGLQLVDALASAWGVRSSAGDLGKTVWFTLALPEPPALTGAAPAG